MEAQVLRRRWSARTVAIALTTGLLIVIGSILLMGVMARPAYRATAEMVLESGISDSGPRRGLPPPSEEQILQSPRVATDAANLLQLWSGTDPDTLDDWPEWLAGPEDLQGFSLSEDDFLRNRSVSTSRDSNEIEVSFTADDAAVARIGANTIIEAYRDIRGDAQVVSLSFAPTPERFDSPESADVLRFIGISALVLLGIFKLWPRTDDRPTST